MERLEKHIKDTLEKRRLSPSPKAWDTIASSLGKEEITNTKRGYWYAIAASVIGLLITAIVYFNAQFDNEKSTEVVRVEKEPVIESKGVENPKKPAIVATTVGVEEELQQGIAVNTEHISSDAKKNIQKRSEAALVEVLYEEQNSIKDGFLNSNTQDVLIDKKISEVLATVINLESEAIQVTDAEVDSLLRVAQSDILKEKIFKGNATVDAMALLTEVEDELDQSFRDKIFIKLKEGLFKARTAVADRNN